MDQPILNECAWHRAVVAAKAGKYELLPAHTRQRSGRAAADRAAESVRVELKRIIVGPKLPRDVCHAGNAVERPDCRRNVARRYPRNGVNAVAYREGAAGWSPAGRRPKRGRCHPLRTWHFLPLNVRVGRGETSAVRRCNARRGDLRHAVTPIIQGLRGWRHHGWCGHERLRLPLRERSGGTCENQNRQCKKQHEDAAERTRPRDLTFGHNSFPVVLMADHAAPHPLQAPMPSGTTTGRTLRTSARRRNYVASLVRCELMPR